MQIIPNLNNRSALLHHESPRQLNSQIANQQKNPRFHNPAQTPLHHLDETHPIRHEQDFTHANTVRNPNLIRQNKTWIRANSRNFHV
jgi:hypothetical protein